MFPKTDGTSTVVRSIFRSTSIIFQNFSHQPHLLWTFLQALSCKSSEKSIFPSDPVCTSLLILPISFSHHVQFLHFSLHLHFFLGVNNKMFCKTPMKMTMVRPPISNIESNVAATLLKLNFTKNIAAELQN